MESLLHSKLDGVGLTFVRGLSMLSPVELVNCVFQRAFWRQVLRPQNCQFIVDELMEALKMGVVLLVNFG